MAAASTHPLLLAALFWAVYLVAARAIASTPTFHLSWIGIARTAAALTLSLFGLLVVWYATRTAYFDPAEPTITAVAAAYRAGNPLYPALDAVERYAHVYGPLLFLVQAWALTLAGASIATSKAVGAVAVAACLALTYRTCARRRGATAAALACAGAVLIYLDFSNAAFWTRPDPLLLLASTLGLWAVDAFEARMAGPSSLLLGVLGGTAVNLKLTGPLYLIPMFVLLQQRHGWRPLIRSCVIGAATAVVPFLLPRISLGHYTQYLELSAGNGLSLTRLRQNIAWATVLMLPAIASWMRSRSRTGANSLPTAVHVSLWLSMLVTAIVAAKPGGGPYHLLPFVTTVAFVLVMTPVDAWRRALVSLVLAVATMALFVAIPRQIILVRTMAGRPLGDAMAEARAFADAHADARVAVGYAGTSYLSQARVALIFRSGRYWLDAPAIQEYRLAGLPLPSAVIEAVNNCRETFWLIPRGAPAFVVPSAYWPSAGPAEVFPEAFRDAFLRRYALIDHLRAFDVWACRAPAHRPTP